MIKVLVSVPHFAPYRDRVFQELEKTRKFEFLFLLTSENKTHPEWKYHSPSFNYKKINSEDFYKGIKGIHRDYISTLNEYKPDVVILCGGYQELVYTRIFYKNIKLIFSADTSEYGKNWKKWWNKLLLKFIYNCPDGIFVPGEKSKQYFSYYIKDKSKIKLGSYTNDVDMIKENYLSYDIPSLRDKFNISTEDYVFLFVGKLIKDRKIENILRIAEKMDQIAKNIKFLIVGNGPDEYLVKEYLKKYSNLIYIPTVPINDLEFVYAISDAYLYLGWEPYSLALYEAAILGKPIIATSSIGAMYDCLKHLENGYGVTNENDEEIIKVIMQMADGKFDEGAKTMALFIEQNRGVKWAANQLYQLMMEEVKK